MAEEGIHTVLTFVELTTVHYDLHDPWGLLMAYVTLVPIAIAVGVMTLIMFRRDLRTAAVFAGLLFSECTNYILKKTIKESRPTIWIGLILAPIWFSFVELVLIPHVFPWIIDHPIGRYFYLRDSSCIENLLEFEYNNAMRVIRANQKSSATNATNAGHQQSKISANGQKNK
eukprot:gene10240-11936_t